MLTNQKTTRLLFGILVGALILRIIIGVALFSGSLTSSGGCHQKGFWECGFVEYAELAINFSEGKGLYRVDEIEGERWSVRPPMYPLLLAALYMSFGKSSVPPIVVQAFIGTLTVLFTYLIARHIFSEQIGILASALAAIYPYYVLHDTQLQETALFTLLTAVTIFAFLKICKSTNLYQPFFSGILLALTVLTRVTLLLLLPFAILWLAMVLKNNRVKIIAAVLLGFILASAPWLIRNFIIHGKPVFEIQKGVALWVSNNPYTLTGYPYEHIDRMTAKAWNAVPGSEKEKLKNMSEIERDEWFKRKAIEFIRENPRTVLKGALLKIYAVTGWNFSPTPNSWLKRLSYTASYFPLLILGFIGIFMTRDKWKELSIIYYPFLAFIFTSAVFFGHTTHRVYLDIYLIIFSSYALMEIKNAIYQRLKGGDIGTEREPSLP